MPNTSNLSDCLRAWSYLWEKLAESSELTVDRLRAYLRVKHGLTAAKIDALRPGEVEAILKADAAKSPTNLPVAKTEQGEGDGGKPPKCSRKGKGGKPALSQAEEEKRLGILRDWWQAQEVGVKRKDFCRDKGVKVNVLKQYVNWHGTRRRRIRDAN